MESTSLCYCPPEYNNINLVVKNEYDNRKKGKNIMVAKHIAEKERKYLLNRSLLSARITRISHQISAFIYGNANELFLGESGNLHLQTLTFFMAQKIHLSRVVSAVKDELRPRKWFIGRLALLLCTKWLQFLFEFFFSKAKSNFAKKSTVRESGVLLHHFSLLLLLLQIVFKVTSKLRYIW